MKIQKLNLKHFGKFTDKTIPLSDGVNILYGENESGKSTVHTFIRSMFFGLERGRGRASVNDTFSMYEPWENPNYYSGKLQFESGGKSFQLERNFDKYSKKAEFFCIEDGEELSVENGDLDVVLEGLTESVYDNTISIGQLKVEPSLTIAAELKNFAANYYAAGDQELNLSAALEKLRDRKKEIDKEVNSALKEKQIFREKIEQESSYIWREIHKLQDEYERLDEEISNRKAKEKEQKQQEAEKGLLEEMRAGKWRIHPIELLAVLIICILPFVLIPKPWSYFVTIVIFLCGGNYIWNRMKVSKKQEKTESEKMLEEITPDEEKIPVERLVGKRELLGEELKDKQIQYDNLQEQLEDMNEMSGLFKEQDKKRQAVILAEQKLVELSEQLRSQLEFRINSRASEIIESITGGKYSRFMVEDNLKMSLIYDGKKIAVEKLSRGTIEQIYFAFRMAVSEIVCTEEYPVILDDTFAYYDDVRLGHTLKWLYENKKQVLIFTCQKREEEALAKLRIPYNREEI